MIGREISALLGSSLGAPGYIGTFVGDRWIGMDESIVRGRTFSESPSWIHLYNVPWGTFLYVLAPDQGLEDPGADRALLTRPLYRRATVPPQARKLGYSKAFANLMTSHEEYAAMRVSSKMPFVSAIVVPTGVFHSDATIINGWSATRK